MATARTNMRAPADGVATLRIFRRGLKSSSRAGRCYVALTPRNGISATLIPWRRFSCNTRIGQVFLVRFLEPPATALAPGTFSPSHSKFLRTGIENRRWKQANGICCISLMARKLSRFFARNARSPICCDAAPTTGCGAKAAACFTPRRNRTLACRLFHQKNCMCFAVVCLGDLQILISQHATTCLCDGAF